VRRAVVVILPLLAASAGCGGSGLYSGPLYPTTGQVLLADGQPLTGGSVRFIPKQNGLPATGKIGPDGAFSLTTKTREGAAPGEYKVRIEPSPEMLSKKGGAVQKLAFAAKYRNYEGNTGLTATIDAGPTRLEPFRLEAK
jgi:hypothetical protein